MTKKNNLKRSIFAALILAGALTLGSCSKDDNNSTKQAAYVLSGTADGTQMVPTAVAGTGTGTISGTYDPNTGQLNYTVTWTGLTGTPIFGSIYTGANGDAGATFGNPFSFDVNVSSTGTTTGSYALTGEDATELIGGRFYYSFGTAANPDGEIRGQIKATR